MIDWTTLRPTQRGVTVEGKNDKLWLEAFLDAGEQQGLWKSWRARLNIEAAGKFDNVLREISEPANQNRIWGLIDRDWRTASEVAELQGVYPHLVILPRIMIENYCIAPDDLLGLLPPIQRAKLDATAIAATIDGHCQEWLNHGALSAVLHEKGAEEFCRGNTGYPRALLERLVTDETQIFNTLQDWHQQLEPSRVLGNFKKRIAEYQGRPFQDQYRQCVDGKMFFNQVIVPEILNKRLVQHDRDFWFASLMSTATVCPPDLVPLLQRLVI